MNAIAASKATATAAWLVAFGAFLGAGAAAPFAPTQEPAAAPVAKAHLAIGKTECSECHGELTSKAHVHAAALDCSSCHEYAETPGAEEGTVKLMAAGQELCLTCHSDMQEKLQGAKFVHAPIGGAGCVACHEPHSTEAASLLKAQPEALCLSCHAFERTANPKNKTRKRILETSDGRGHPIMGHPYKGVPDPSANGAALSCRSCHDSHFGADHARLKPGKVKDDFCSRCH
jgi:predicted CXXCH cytochrome family protein